MATTYMRKCAADCASASATAAGALGWRSSCHWHWQCRSEVKRGAACVGATAVEEGDCSMPSGMIVLDVRFQHCQLSQPLPLAVRVERKKKASHCRLPVAVPSVAPRSRFGAVNIRHFGRPACRNQPTGVDPNVHDTPHLIPQSKFRTSVDKETCLSF
jgi:hypothetical protein